MKLPVVLIVLLISINCFAHRNIRGVSDLPEGKPPTQMPELSISNKNLNSIVSQYAGKKTLILSSDHLFGELSQFKNLQNVPINTVKVVIDIMKKKNFSNYKTVVAVGGCGVLDVGRALGVGRELILIPTILSTACISVNYPILNKGADRVSYVAATPKKVIVSLPASMAAKEKDKWSRSGLGDLLADISAAIEAIYESDGKFSRKRLKKIAPNAYHSIFWMKKHFVSWGEEELTRLAHYLHDASIEDILNADDEEFVHVGAEHAFYNELMDINPNLRVNGPSHGEIVAFGTLLTVLFYSLEFNDKAFYNDLRNVYKKVGLPIKFNDLIKKGMKGKEIKKGLEIVANEYSGYLAEKLATKGAHKTLAKYFGPIGKRNCNKFLISE